MTLVENCCMGKSRLEAFSDGVIAIIITIMVLELRAPHEATLGALHPLWPIFTSYILSFIYVGIYWNNHHHLWQAAETVHGGILWANLHLLFWLSLVPFATDWIGQSHFAALPVATYGLIMLMTAIAFTILAQAMVKHHGRESELSKALRNGTKEKVSMLMYVIGIAGTMLNPWIGMVCYAIVAAMWLVPDRRIEARLVDEAPAGKNDLSKK